VSWSRFHWKQEAYHAMHGDWGEKRRRE
jgi:hypothetical protein